MEPELKNLRIRIESLNHNSGSVQQHRIVDPRRFPSLIDFDLSSKLLFQDLEMVFLAEIIVIVLLFYILCINVEIFEHSHEWILSCGCRYAAGLG